MIFLVNFPAIFEQEMAIDFFKDPDLKKEKKSTCTQKTKSRRRSRRRKKRKSSLDFPWKKEEIIKIKYKQIKINSKTS